MFIFCSFLIQNMLIKFSSKTKIMCFFVLSHTDNIEIKKSPLIPQTFISGTSGGRGESLRKSYIVYISSLFSPNFQQLKLILLR